MRFIIILQDGKTKLEGDAFDVLNLAGVNHYRLHRNGKVIAYIPKDNVQCIEVREVGKK